MGKALYLESVAGVAGDMFAAAFVDAGLVTADALNDLAVKLGLEGVTVELSSVIRATVRATHLKVSWTDESWKLKFGHQPSHDPHNHSSDHANTNLLLGDEAADHWHTHYSDITALIENSSLDGKTKDLALRIFRSLAEAEADAHGIEVEKVAFHEVGTIDSILDVVMGAYCITRTEAAAVYATPIKPGRGTVTMKHGTHPVPPPASIRLVVGMPVSKTPTTVTRENIELSTPTGIAIVKALSPEFVGEMPSGTLICQGMGAGTMDLGNFPNVFRVSVIETDDEAISLPFETDRVVEIVCNIDDDTGEHLAWMAERLMQDGALDVWQTPVVGKKGRVMICLSVLTNENDWQMFADWILRNSTTFGIRHRKWDRVKLAREFENRETLAGTISYKVGFTTEGEKLKEKPEFDDVKNLAID